MRHVLALSQVLMLEEMGRRFNFSWTYHIPPDGTYGTLKANGVWSGVMGEVAYARVDWAMSDILLAMERSRIAEMSATQFDEDYMAFVAPQATPKQKWTAIVRPFDKWVWAAIVSSIFIFSFGLVVLSSISESMRGIPATEWSSFANNTWFSFSTFIGESVMRYEAQIDNGVLQVLIVTWYLYSFVATSGFSGNLRSFFINPGLDEPIDTLSGVLDSSLPWGMTRYDNDEEKFMSLSKDPIVSEIWQGKQHVDRNNIFGVMDSVSQGKMVLIDWRKGIEPQIKIRYMKGGKTSIHLASHRFTQFNGGSGWYFNKFFPHTNDFNKFITKCFEAGLIQAWKDKTYYGMKLEFLRSNPDHGKDDDVDEDKIKSLTIAELQGCFFLLSFGLFVSLLVWVVLHIYFRYHANKDLHEIDSLTSGPYCGNTRDISQRPRIIYGHDQGDVSQLPACISTASIYGHDQGDVSQLPAINIPISARNTANASVSAGVTLSSLILQKSERAF